METSSSFICILTDVCVVYAVVALITGMDWLFRGRKRYRGSGERRAEVGVHRARELVAVDCAEAVLRVG